MSRRGFAILAAALVATNAFFWLAQGGFALPRALIDRFFGPRLVRAEVILQSGPGVTRDYRLDRGVITQAAPDSITLRERDGTVVTIPVSPSTRVIGFGRPAGVSRLRPRLRVLVVREANAPAQVIEIELRGP